jgi:hypothetical protein
MRNMKAVKDHVDGTPTKALFKKVIDLLLSNRLIEELPCEVTPATPAPVPTYHCPICRKTWYLGGEELPRYGYCPGAGCGGAELQDGAATAGTQLFDLTADDTAPLYPQSTSRGPKVRSFRKRSWSDVEASPEASANRKRLKLGYAEFGMEAMSTPDSAAAVSTGD